MRIVGRTIRPALLAAALVVSLAGVARAGGEAGGDITFRLVLRGDVIEGDAFFLGVGEVADDPTIISPGIRCGPGSELYTSRFVACEPGTYDFVVKPLSNLPIGAELEYGWARIHGDGQSTAIYTGTVTVSQNAQVFTVVYDYGGGQPLPDTGMRAPADWVPLGVVAIISSMLGGVVASRRWRRAA